MEDRINIGGVWYVREDKTSLEDLNLDYTWFEGCVIETDDYAFEITRIRIDEDDINFYDNITIEFTDKRPTDREDWIREHWDNNDWFIGILEEREDSINLLEETLPLEGQRLFKKILNDLYDKSWLRK